MLKTIWRWLKLIWGWAWISLAVLATIGVLADESSGKSPPEGVFVGIGFFAAIGGVLLWSAYKKPAQTQQGQLQPRASVAVPQTEVMSVPPSVVPATPPSPTPQNDLLAVAAQHDGLVTITDCASDLGLPFGAARDALEAAVRAKECTSEMQDGRVVYDFRQALRRR